MPRDKGQDGKGQEDQLKKTNALIIPTRGRGRLIEPRVLQSLALSSSTDLYLSVDDSDTSDYGWAHKNGVSIITGPNSSMNQALNRAAKELSDSYSYLTFMGDDHIARTQDWDLRLIEALEKTGGFGLAYGNDLLAGKLLPTAVLMDSRIVSSLGYMSPPQLRHMFLDDFWLEIGNRAGCIHYLDHVVIEHLHFSVGKSEKDQIYENTNKNSKNLRDKLIFSLYKLVRLRSDLRKIKSLLPSPS